MSWFAQTILSTPSCWDTPGKEDIIESLRDGLWNGRIGMAKKSDDLRTQAFKRKGECVTLARRTKYTEAREAANDYASLLFESEEVMRGINLIDQLYRATEPQKVIQNDVFVHCEEAQKVVRKIFVNQPTYRMFEWIIDELIRIRIVMNTRTDTFQPTAFEPTTNPYNGEILFRTLINSV